MARISTYEQDSTLHVNDKLLGTDSGTAATKNFTIQSIVDLINDEGLIGRPLSVSYDFGTYDEDTAEPRGVVALGTSNPTPGNYSDVTEIVISKQEKGGLNVETFLESLVGYNIRISDRDGNKTNYGVFTVAAVADIDDNNDNFLRMTLTHQNSKGTIALAGKFYITVNPSEPSQADWDATSGKHEILNKPDNFIFETSSVTDLSDVTSAGSGAIITTAERNKLASGVVPTSRTIQIQGTANGVEVSPSIAQDLSGNRTFRIGLTDDVIINDDLLVTNRIIVGGPIEYTGIVSSTPTFDNGIYYNTEDGHDTLHFRYHGHDLSIDHLTENVPTGILNGGELTKANSTQFTIAAGNGVINVLNKSNSDPHPEIKQISWSGQTITVSNLDSNETDQLNSWIYVDDTGTVQQQATPLTDAQKRSNLLIGSAIHSEGVLKFVKTFPLTGYSNISQMTEFIQTFGPMKKSGHVVSANGANLSIDRAAGTAFALGRNYANDPLNPSTVSDNSKTTCVIHRYYGDGSNGFILDDGASGNGYTVLDPGKYDDGSGTLASMSSGHYSVQRLYYFPGTPDIVIAYYGRDEYNSMQEAENNYLKESFVEASNTAEQAIYLGAVILKGNVTELNDTDDAKFLTSGTFRSLAAVNVGGAIASEVLNDLSDVNIQNVANDQVLKYNSTAGQWRNVADSVDPISLDSINGRAGLNVPSPSATFDVKTTETANSAKIFDFKSNGDVSRLYLQNDGDLAVNTDDLYVDASNSRVGIGTDIPDSILHIREANPTLKVFSGASSGNSSILSLGKAYNGSSTIEFHNTTSGEPLVAQIECDTSENMVFETNPDGVLGSNNSFIFQQAGTEAMRIDPSGNVGIGVDPESLLTVGANLNNAVTFDYDFNVRGALIHGIGSGESYLYLHRDDVTIYKNNVLGSINFSGADGGSYIGASIKGVAAGTWSSTNALSNLVFETTENGATSPTERMRIDSDGNVGIGTDTPFRNLDVQGTDANIRVKATNASGEASISIHGLGSNGSSSAETEIKAIPEGSGSAASMTFTTRDSSGNRTERMRINSDGRVLIGDDTAFDLNAITMSPNGQVFANNLALANGAGSVGGTSPHIYSPASGELGISSLSSEHLRIDSSGNVGIGATGPISKLTLEGERNTNTITLRTTNNDSVWSSGDEYGAIEFYSNDASGGGAGVKSKISCFTTRTSGADSHLTFSTSSTTTNNVERMRIDNVGNVGIGTGEDIDAKLEVQNAGDVSIRLNDSTTNYWDLTNDSNLIFSRGGTERMRIDSNGSIGIGDVSPSLNTAYDRMIHIHSTLGSLIKLTEDGSGSGVNDGTDLIMYSLDFYIHNRENGNILFYNSGSESMRIDSDGNVNIPNGSLGIGISTTPSAELDVNGTIAFNSLKDTAEDITITKFVDEADTIASNNNDTTIPTSAAVDAHIESKSTTDRNNSYKIMGIAMDYLSRVHDDGGTVEGMEDVMKNTEELILA